VARPRISAALQDKVRERANFLCEYCHTCETWQYVPFTVDHVIPLLEGGATNEDNLALACFHCNRQKSLRTAAPDPQTGQEAPLFNPRQQQWREHFIWSPDKLLVIGLTPVGRATVAALRFNRQRIIPIRAADIAVNRHPPRSDPVQSA
jgi:hypothetical protein